MRGRPGCMRACHPADSVCQSCCLRKCPIPPVISRVVIPSRSCRTLFSPSPVHSGRHYVSTALRELGTSRRTCGVWLW
eukprot:4968748-Prymnesium_polylepis.1